MVSKRILANFSIAIGAVVANKIRSLLTALGIIFGVAAVIAMLAIGNGAQKEILDQIKLVGLNNIVIKPIVEQEEKKVDDQAAQKERKKFSPGLTLRDVAKYRGHNSWNHKCKSRDYYRYLCDKKWIAQVSKTNRYCSRLLPHL